ncbi:hypothetical protein K439DRAFT_1665960 [Ramaria rubella]|nr:hypothetical protein K439DRAFT_1665960 [Ramaria rubella]
MRFLAIVSVFFAVTQVAFAAPVFRVSHLIPHTLQERRSLIDTFVQTHKKLKRSGSHSATSEPLDPQSIEHTTSYGTLYHIDSQGTKLRIDQVSKAAPNGTRRRLVAIKHAETGQALRTHYMKVDHNGMESRIVEFHT